MDFKLLAKAYGNVEGRLCRVTRIRLSRASFEDIRVKTQLMPGEKFWGAEVVVDDGLDDKTVVLTDDVDESRTYVV